jgi:protein-disulfide isomerase
MGAAVAASGRRRGRWVVLVLLVLAVFGVTGGLVELSTQEPDRDRVHITGVGDAQQIFGGVRQDDDRLGSPDAAVSIQVFDDLQCGNCRTQFLSTIPTLVEDYVRPGDVKLEYRHYSFGPRSEQLGFYGAEAAADQDYAWPYIYLFFRSQKEAERVGIDDDFLESVAGSIPELDVPEWRDYLEQEGGPDGRIGERLAGYERLGEDLGIRANPAAIVSGPGGTRTLQDRPSLAQITAAIDAVG